MTDDVVAAATEEQTGSKRKQPSEPPSGYTCSLCGIAGHWIQQCPERTKRRSRTKRKPDREFIPGIEPSPDDIEQAREMQRLKPPLCYCGKDARIKKVKQSRVSKDSRAIGKYFFFCAERRDDHPKCRFARPAEEQMQLLNGRPPPNEEPSVKKQKVMCTFFAKSGGCNKGSACNFSHDVSTKSK
jgi:hypothetical protein